MAGGFHASRECQERPAPRNDDFRGGLAPYHHLINFGILLWTRFSFFGKMRAAMPKRPEPLQITSALYI